MKKSKLVLIRSKRTTAAVLATCGLSSIRRTNSVSTSHPLEVRGVYITQFLAIFLVCQLIKDGKIIYHRIKKQSSSIIKHTGSCGSCAMVPEVT